MGAVFQFGATWKLIALWISVLLPFAMATWEEYFTGELVLPYINGPTDGITLSYIFTLICVRSPGLWSRQLVEFIPLDLLSAFQYTIESALPRSITLSSDWLIGCSINSMILVLIIVMLIPTLAINVISVLRRKRHHRNQYMIAPLVPFFAVIVSICLWSATAASSSESTNLLTDHTIALFLAHGFMFAQLVMRLMLGHLTNSRFTAWQIILFPLLVLCLGQTLPAIVPQLIQRQLLSSDTAAVYIATLWSFCTWLFFSVVLCLEISTALDIPVFQVPKRKNR